MNLVRIEIYYGSYKYNHRVIYNTSAICGTKYFANIPDIIAKLESDKEILDTVIYLIHWGLVAEQLGVQVNTFDDAIKVLNLLNSTKDLDVIRKNLSKILEYPKVFKEYWYQDDCIVRIIGKVLKKKKDINLLF